MVVAIDAIDTAASAEQVTDTTTRIPATDISSSWYCNSAARCPPVVTALRCKMQQASAAFSSAEAEVFGMQRASSDQSAVSCSTQHDSHAGSAHMFSLSGCCDDLCTEEHLEADHAQEPADARYSADTVHYSRHQGAHHRPAVRWQSNADILESAQSRHSPQHLILSPNKSCMKQKPGGYALWFSDTQPEQACADIKPWRSCLKSIDGNQGSKVMHGRKRSRLCSLD